MKRKSSVCWMHVHVTYYLKKQFSTKIASDVTVSKDLINLTLFPRQF